MYEFNLVKSYKEEFKDLFNNEQELENFLLASKFTTSFFRDDDGNICVETEIDSPYEKYLMEKSNEIMGREIEPTV